MECFMHQEQAFREFNIPAHPGVLSELQQLNQSPQAPLGQFADIIARDVGLSASVLKTVNAPAFGLGRQITDIHNAVHLLGTRVVSQLVAGQLLRQSIRGKSSISLEKFWDTATQTAQVMLLLRDHLRLRPACSSEDAYSFGLFRDCGIPIMAIRYPDYREVLMEANDAPQQVFTDVEERHYPVNHAIIGYYVTQSWHLPDALAQLILRHHDPSFLEDTRVSEAQKTLYALAKVAVNVLSRVKYQKEDPEWPAVGGQVLEHLRLSEYDHDILQADMADELMLRDDIC
ncbi:signal transduction protein [Ectothiorhodospira mobilis]|nr:signal transduction protein [Ectothiorhodospira mobilis]